MSPVRHTLVLAAALSVAQSAAARPQTSGIPPPCARCIVVELAAADAADLASPEATATLAGAQVLVGIDDWRRLSAETVHRLARTGIELTLESARIDGLPDADVLRSLAGLVLDLRRAPGAVETLAFTIKQRSTDAKAINSDLRIGIEADESAIAALVKQGVAPYIDFAMVDRPPRAESTDLDAGLPLWIRGETRAGFAALAPPADPRAERVVRALPAPYVATLAALSGVLPRTLFPFDEMHVQCEPACAARAWLNAVTLDAVALVDLPESPRAIRIVPDPGPAARVLNIDERGTLTARALASMPDAAHAGRVLIHVPAGADQGRFATGVQVSARRRLTVDEILARHQQARARQRRIVRSLIASGRTMLTFDAPGFVAPITITADTVMYATAGVLEIEQRDIRVNGLTLGRSTGVPRLPLIEAERLSTPPLVLALTSAYRYRLAGDDTIAGRRCYVVAFDVSAGAVSGRAWISAGDFGMVRVEFVQRSSRGPIVSSEQRDEFMPVMELGATVWLSRRTEIHQMYEGPMHRTPIHRVIETTAHAINPADFDERLRAAHAGPAIMLRETAEGFRYLAHADGADRAERRVIPARESQRVRTFAFGVIVDPNITRPLPFAGLSYLDFNLFGTGTHVNAFAGAGYGRLALTTPALGRTRWQLVVNGFAIAARYNDRVFASGRERYDLNLRQRPAQAMAGVMGPLGPALRVRAEYHVDYTRLERAETTRAEFVVPPSPIVHAARISVDAQRGPWSGGAWWSPARRQRWDAWGIPGGADLPSAGATARDADRARVFHRYGLALARSFVFSNRTVARVDAAWMDGRDLDRFSRYTFGTFENRLRGYPAASIRYDRGFAAHSVASWSAGRRLRLDGFFDLAAVREPARGNGLRTYPGAGAAIEVPMPFGLLTAVEWGYGPRGLTSSGREGTQVFRLTAYKMF